MSPRPDVSKERRNQIIDAASLVFARLGFNKARMEDISDEAKLSKGALYLYFKSKDAVITALLRRFFDPTLEDIRGLVVAAWPRLRARLRAATICPSIKPSPTVLPF